MTLYYDILQMILAGAGTLGAVALAVGFAVSFVPMCLDMAGLWKNK